MQFGYFDDENKEYVVDTPNTPQSWSNYLGSTEYGAIITNNAGGYSFYNSAASGRFLRLRPNTIPQDQPGRYVYLHDRDSKDYWSAAWQPVGKPLSEYKSVCRHGTAYTVITSEYRNISSEMCYFVPLGKLYECWHVTLKNMGTDIRKLRAFTFVEYSNHWELWQDIVNLQYSQYILKMDVVDGIIDHGTNINLPHNGIAFDEEGQSRHTFLGIAGARVTGFDTDRKAFIGAYRSYNNPIVVEQGRCTNSLAESDNGCGTLQVDITLEPEAEISFTVVMGIGTAAKEGRKALQSYGQPERIAQEFHDLKHYWHSRLGNMQAQTPDAAFNSTLNMWGPYNCLITYAWSRAASLVYNGERNGLGYRDTVQDILGVLHAIPDEARTRLELMITGQVSGGGAMPVVKQFSHKPGCEKAPFENEYRSDDCLWLFNSVPAYVKETGDIDFYNKVLPYADKGEDSVMGHLRRAIEFNLDRMGAHDLPCGLRADWNDCLVLGQKGESIFVAFQLRYALVTYGEIAGLLKKPSEQSWALTLLEQLDTAIEKHAWEGDRYIRAFRWDGIKFGSRESDEGQLWLNPQTWAVLSGHAIDERAGSILGQVERYLATEYGLMICDSPYMDTGIDVIRAPLFNRGTKENGGIFCHIQGWAVMAEAMQGNGDLAYRYFRAYMPAACNTKAEIREIEPYVYCQSTHSKYSKRFGASRLPWLSGAATWAFYAASQYIIGIRPEYDGITIDPCIPSAWEEFSVQRRFRGKLLLIRILNPHHIQKGVSRIQINDEEIEGRFIPFERLREENQVVVYME